MDFTAPHPDDTDLRRFIAQTEAFEAFRTDASTEVVLTGYLDRVGA